jgi:O-antigen/teichoic acid export membrane protein
MAIRIGRKDVTWGYLSQILYTGINILLLPFVLKLLPESELGLWYTFIAIGALANLLDFGFKTTITRNIAYAWGGAKELPKEGQDIETTTDEPNLKLLMSVIKTASTLYLIIGGIALTLLATIGTWYIMNITNNQMAINDYMVAWIIYIIAIFLNIYYGYWMPLLKGIGAIKENYQSMVISKVIHLLIAVIGLFLGFKLTAIAVAYFVSSLATRILSKWMFKNYSDIKVHEETLKKIKVSFSDFKKTFLIMWPNAYKQGVMSLSNYLTDKVAILVCSSAYGLTVSAQLGLTIQLLSVTSTVGNVLFNSLMPYIIQLKMKHDYKRAYEMITISIGAQTLIILSGGIVITFLANPILNFIGSNSSVLPIKESIILTLFVYVFANHQICSSYIIAGNKMPMYKAYIITGLLTVISEIVFTNLYGSFLNIMTILLPQLILQLAYNAWRWPAYIAKVHEKKQIDLYIDSLRNLKNILNVRLLKSEGRSV